MSWSSWLPWSGSEVNPRSDAPSTAPIAPTASAEDPSNYRPLQRSERQACWTARDAYFACLDRNDIIDPVKDGAASRAKCGPSEQSFHKDCANSWAQYFKKKRVVDYERDQKMQKMAGQTMVRPQGQQQQQDKPFWKIW